MQIRFFVVVFPLLPVNPITFTSNFDLLYLDKFCNSFREFSTKIILSFLSFNLGSSTIESFAPLFKASSAKLLPSKFSPLIEKKISSFFIDLESMDTPLDDWNCEYKF